MILSFKGKKMTTNNFEITKTNCAKLAEFEWHGFVFYWDKNDNILLEAIGNKFTKKVKFSPYDD